MIRRTGRCPFGGVSPSDSKRFGYLNRAFRRHTIGIRRVGTAPPRQFSDLRPGKFLRYNPEICVFEAPNI